jgi:hypothetical protein
VRFEKRDELSRTVSETTDFSVTERAVLIKNLVPDIFVCNAISGFWYNYFVSNGINIYPHVKGKIETIIEMTLNNGLKKVVFSGPVCRRGGKGRRAGF